VITILAPGTPRSTSVKGGAGSGGTPFILIGPVSDDQAESVSSVNKAFISGLKCRHSFLLLQSTRTLGNTRQAALNVFNLWYFLIQASRWVCHLASKRPALAHYAISSGWAMEKSLLLLRIARLFRARTLGHLHSGGFLDFWRTLPPWRKRLALKALSRLDGIVVLSQGWREAFSKTVGIPRDKLFVVNNPIDAAFEEQALQIPISRTQKSLTVLSLGAMCKDKGTIETLEAMRLLRGKNVRLRMVGPEREPGIHRKVREFIGEHDLGEMITLEASAWGPDKLEAFREASIFILPSYFENFPLVLLEAAAAGHAIITTPVGAVPEFFTHGESALFIEPKNARQLSNALSELISNVELRTRLAEASRRVFTSRLARSRIMDAMSQVYEDILHR
jgi:glycosyltransferase involved in cell wall biosynthesis